MTKSKSTTATTSLMPIADALARILRAMSALPNETVSLANASGRVLAEDVLAGRTQPPFDASAMDGFAVRATDVQSVPTTLRLIGESAAGDRFTGQIAEGEAVRIFTGAPLPEGADSIVIQEDTEFTDTSVEIYKPANESRFVRKAGLDFREGEQVLAAGTRLGSSAIALAAAANIPWLTVRRRPRVGLLATGDELVYPGQAPGPDQIIASNALGLSVMIRDLGGVPVDLGIARDTEESLNAHIDKAEGLDLLITLGGASVGDHDLVGKVLAGRGMTLDFWKIAMRPGKPLMFGNLGGLPVIGLPGNPVSALVCGLVFVAPAIRALLGSNHVETPLQTAILGADLAANDQRQDYLRSRLETTTDGSLIAHPFSRQDSSMLSVLARSYGLVIRPPFAPPAKTGDRVSVLMFS